MINLNEIFPFDRDRFQQPQKFTYQTVRFLHRKSTECGKSATDWCVKQPPDTVQQDNLEVLNNHILDPTFDQMGPGLTMEQLRLDQMELYQVYQQLRTMNGATHVTWEDHIMVTTECQVESTPMQ